MAALSALEIRRIRLPQDHQYMENIRRDWLKWEAGAGTPPFVESYKLTVKIRTVVGPRPDFRDLHEIVATLPPAYPDRTAKPVIFMTTTPYVFHPNWFTSGQWCTNAGAWDFSESLAELIVRMIQTLQFDPDITNPNSVANQAANTWYLRHKSSGMFPTDRTELPDPTTSQTPRIKIKKAGTSFTIKSRE